MKFQQEKEGILAPGFGYIKWKELKNSVWAYAQNSIWDQINKPTRDGIGGKK